MKLRSCGYISLFNYKKKSLGTKAYSLSHCRVGKQARVEISFVILFDCLDDLSTGNIGVCRIIQVSVNKSGRIGNVACIVFALKDVVAEKVLDGSVSA